MQDRFNILALSGGGYLGLFTAYILEALENESGRPLARSFDLIAGTSIGGILALALASETPMSDVRKAFEDRGELIFSSRGPARGPAARALEFGQMFFKSKYSSTGLRETLTGFWDPKAVVGSLPHRCIVAAVSATEGKPKLFKTAHHEDFFRDRTRTLIDVALSTSAAPTIFPLHEMDGELMADGGLFANAPDLLAVHEAEHYLKRPINDIHLLSLGATTSQFGLSNARKLNLGVFGWMMGQDLIQLTMSAQQRSVEFLMEHRLGPRYVRLNSLLSAEQQQDVGLDIATFTARKILKAHAEKTIQSHIRQPKVSAFLSHQAPTATFFGV